MCGNTKQTPRDHILSTLQINDIIESRPDVGEMHERWVVTEVFDGSEGGPPEYYPVRAQSLLDGKFGLFKTDEFFLVQPEAKFKAGDKVRIRRDVDLTGRWMKAGARYVVNSTRPSGDGGEGQQFVVFFHDGVRDAEQRLFEKFFELDDTPAVTLEQRTAEARNAAKANMRKRAHLRLLEGQNAALRKELGEVRERNAKLIRANHELAQRVMQSQLIPSPSELSAAKHALGVAILRAALRGPSLSLLAHEVAPHNANEVFYAGHAGQGGLQKHSIGDEYPYIVEGYQEHPTAEVVYQIRDAESGNVWHSKFPDAASASNLITKYWKAADRTRAAQGKPRIKIADNGNWSI